MGVNAPPGTQARRLAIMVLLATSVTCLARPAPTRRPDHLEDA